MFFRAPLCYLALLVSSFLILPSAHADVMRVNYDLDGTRFDIRGTPFGFGDGSFLVGPGTLAIDYPLSGDTVVDGTVRLRSYALILNFTAGTTGAQVTSDLTSQANFTEVQAFAEGTLEDGVITWTQSFPYKVVGTNTCVGAFCGFAGFSDGVPQQINTEDPFSFAPFTFDAGGPQAGAGFDGGEVAVPGNDSASTFLLLEGTELSRVRIDTTAPIITLLGEAEIILNCGSLFEDPGVQVSDNVAVSATVTVGGEVVDTNSPGVYSITYNVTDDAGNAAVEVTRSVTVLDNCSVSEGAVDGEGASEGEGSIDGEAAPEGEGALEGEGSLEGEGALEGEGDVEGGTEGMFEGSPEGALEGATDGEGSADGEGELEAEGTDEGEGIAEGEGAVEEGEGLAEGEGAVEEGEGLAEGEGAVEEGEGLAEGEGAAEGGAEGELDGEGSVEGEIVLVFHTADSNRNGRFDLAEVLRVIQFFNAGEFSCALETSEDGFDVGGGDQSCLPHASDFKVQDWIIELSELLRLIQLYNIGEYESCDASEDGFCLKVQE